MVKSDTNDKPQASSHCTSMGCTKLINSSIVLWSIILSSLATPVTLLGPISQKS